MKGNEREYKVVWPEYFDVHSSRDQGRKVPKKHAKEGPELEDIKQAAQRAGLKYVAEEDKAYPGKWYKPKGRLLVYSDLPKTEILAKIGEQLK
jgi:signal recognition particle subunit SEC65